VAFLKEHSFGSRKMGVCPGCEAVGFQLKNPVLPVERQIGTQAMQVW